jgi:hypothetical protein
MKEEEELKEEGQLLAKSEVSLVIGKYDDIFSSFDPRPYSERALSVDFLAEAKRATRETEKGELELRILLPTTQRKVEREGMIKKRLREHFRKHADLLEKEKRGIFRQGILFIIFGIIFMFIASYVLFQSNTRSLFGEFIVVLLEPGGWFLLWEGLDLILFKSKEVKPDLDFYRKMSRADIAFSHY